MSSAEATRRRVGRRRLTVREVSARGGVKGGGLAGAVVHLKVPVHQTLSVPYSWSFAERYLTRNGQGPRRVPSPLRSAGSWEEESAVNLNFSSVEGE